MDPDALSPSQRQALNQLQAVTNGGDAEVAIGVLDSVGWDVQVSFGFQDSFFACEESYQPRSAVVTPLVSRPGSLHYFSLARLVCMHPL